MLSLQSIKEVVPRLISSATTLITPQTSSSPSSLIHQRINNVHPFLLLPAATAITLFLSTLTIQTLNKKINLVSKIYDAVIVNMTEKWYQSVLSQLDDNSVVLDVGVGTAGEEMRENKKN
jgi:hypothetical protein